MTDKQTKEEITEDSKSSGLSFRTIFFMFGIAFLIFLFLGFKSDIPALRNVFFMFSTVAGILFYATGIISFLTLCFHFRFRRIFGIWPSRDECKKYLRKGVVGSKLSRKAGDLDNEFKRKNKYQGYLQTSEEELKQIIRERPPIDLSSLKEEEVALAYTNKQIADNRGIIKSLNKSSCALRKVFWRAHEVARFFGMTKCDGKCSYKLHLFGAKFGT